MTLTLIDLFCGAGGFSLGFEKAGFKTLLAIDKWNDAISTYNYNRKNKCALNIDIHDFNNYKIKLSHFKDNITGIIGGPPCQGFSMVGKRDTHDKRNSLYLEYVRFVQQIKPTFFILENVKGLLSMKNGSYKKDIIKRFTTLGYNVSFKVLKASDYGVPQSRERIFFIGFNKNKFNNTYFDFDQIKKAKQVSTGEALSDLPMLDKKKDCKKYRTIAKNSFQKMMRKGSKFVQNNDVTNHTDATKKIIALIKDGGSIRDLPKKYYKIRNYNAAFKRMDSSKPSCTIDCGHRNYFHYNENRIPTVRECARIQSFPDKYYFTGNKSSQYTQVGNAVPVLLSYAIALTIKNYIKGLNNGNKTKQ